MTTDDSAQDRPQPRWPTEPDFWRLWIVGTVQFSTRWIEILIFAIFTYQQTNSATLVTLMTLLRMLPMALFGLFIGAGADRVERRAALSVTLVVLLLTSVAMAVLSYTGYLAVWHLAVASFISGACWATDHPVRRLLIGEVVGASRMATAMAFDAGSSNGARVIAPALGGIIFASWGIGACFAVEVVLFSIALAMSLAIRHRNLVSPDTTDLVLERIREALRVARGDKGVMGVLCITAIFNIFGWPALSLVAVIGQDYLHLGPRAIGLLASMEGLGAIAGTLMIVFYWKPAGYARLFVTSVALYMIILMAFALTPYAALAGFFLGIAGAAGTSFGIMQSTLMFRAAEPQLRARLFGLLSATIGLGPIGFLQVGLLADALGAQLAIIITAIEGLLVLLLTQRYWRSIDGPEAPAIKS